MSFMFQHKRDNVFSVPFLCFSKEKNQKKGALFQGVFWARPKNQNRFTKFSTGNSWCVKKETLFYLQY